LEIGNTLYVFNRSDWRAWLEINFADQEEIWLIFPKKSSGKPTLVYNDAVEEALCFGWIDSIVKTLDDNHKVQRFSPRRAGSDFSQQNKERLRWLLKHRQVHPSIKAIAREAIADEFVFPEDILAAIKADPQAWKQYQSFSPAYQRIRVAYIDGARKRPEEFEKRLRNFIERSAQGKQIGYGGIDKYF
jgi:uncharacterized protein YdeI (YjbR/CyaY-like superfamily)